ncbi:MAG: cytochrome c biogenesis protein CcsA [Burkholderiales bacterium]|jgi:ABC-type uncharacterized transport system permease subunit
MSILLVIASLLTAALYLPAWLSALRGARGAGQADAGGDAAGAGAARAASEPAPWLLGAGLLTHAYALGLAVYTDEGLRFGFAQVLSGSLLLGVAVLWLEGLSVRVQALRIPLLPAAALACALPLAFPGARLALESARPLFMPHLLAGTLAYGVLTLAALHAALMAAAERSLHAGAGGHRSVFGRWVEELPPLLSLERILFRMITVGFVLLSLTVLSGILFSEATFGRPLRFDHKTVFAVTSWVLFGVLLAGRQMRGWRGRTALRFTMFGFSVLLLAYAGSRFVLEVVLQRA